MCYVYLFDVNLQSETAWPTSFHHCRWFTRGWTLQELLAPRRLRFYSSDWQFLGTKESLSAEITFTTGIGREYLNGTSSIYLASIARRMSWASARSTARVEDLAYCLMGIFAVNMPMLYGEGPRAFIRLQEEIMRDSDDQSLFAWRASCEGDLHGLMADSPAAFHGSGDIIPIRGLFGERQGHDSHIMTNRGLQIHLPCRDAHGSNKMHAMLECQLQSSYGYVGILVQPTFESTRHYARTNCENFAYHKAPPPTWYSLYLRQQVTGSTLTNAAFHQLRRVALRPGSWSSSLTCGAIVGRGTYLDIFGQNVPWSPSEDSGTLKLVNQARLLAAYIMLEPSPMVKFALLIGSDDARQLAFDVWEPTTPAEAKALSIDESQQSARSELPSWLTKSSSRRHQGKRYASCEAVWSQSLSRKTERPFIRSTTWKSFVGGRGTTPNYPGLLWIPPRKQHVERCDSIVAVLVRAQASVSLNCGILA